MYISTPLINCRPSVFYPETEVSITRLVTCLHMLTLSLAALCTTGTHSLILVFYPETGFCPRVSRGIGVRVRPFFFFLETPVHFWMWCRAKLTARLTEHQSPCGLFDDPDTSAGSPGEKSIYEHPVLLRLYPLEPRPWLPRSPTVASGGLGLLQIARVV
jgi:hypothetical protein